MHVSSTARRYGRALARVAIERKKEKTVRAEMEGLRDFFEGSPLQKVTLESPAATTSSKLRVLGQIEQALEAAGKPLTVFTKQTLRALAENKRFHLFREVVEAYGREVDQRHAIVEVEIASATELTETQERDLVGALKRTVAGGSDVRLTKRTDPALIAGFVARVGSTVYDGSLLRQLEQVKQRLVSE
jgi:F-type H+-transporting ATPase subunit delta